MSAFQRRLLHQVEQLYFAVGILLMAGSLSFLLSDLGSLGAYTVEGAIEGNRRFQLFAGVFYGTAIVYLAVNAQKAAALLRRNGWLVAFIGFVLLSVLWSDERALTIRRGIALFGTTAFALHLVMRRPRDEFIELIAMAFVAMVAINLAFIIALPGVGIDFNRGGDWRGVLQHKNAFGTTMALAALVFVVQQRRGGLRGFIYLAMTVVALLMVYLSGSRTAWLMAFGVFVIGMPFFAVLQTGRLSVPARLLLLTVFGLGGLLLVLSSFFGVALTAIGRDATLTDRTIIWDLVFDLGMQRPFLGYGFGAFWQGDAGLIIAELFSSIGHAHNGYIDLWLYLGFVGVAVFLPNLVLLVVRLIREATRYRGPEIAFFPLFVAMILVHNTVARSFPEHSSIVWVLLVAGLAYTSLPYPDCFRRRIPGDRQTTFGNRTAGSGPVLVTARG